MRFEELNIPEIIKSWPIDIPQWGTASTWPIGGEFDFSGNSDRIRRHPDLHPLFPMRLQSRTVEAGNNRSRTSDGAFPGGNSPIQIDAVDGRPTILPL